MGYGILHCLCSANLLYKVYLNWLCQYLSFLNIFFNRFCAVENCGVTPHYLYRDSFALNCSVYVALAKKQLEEKWV